MNIRYGTLLLIFIALLAAGSAQATTLTLSGYMNDQGNTALKWTDLSPALFGDDSEIANNVALYDITVPFAGNVMFHSLGYAAGGIDPYFTLFTGTGISAPFRESNYSQAFSTGGDFDLTFPLAVGNYTVAMSVFANMSLAENYGSGTLGDGFSQLGVPGSLGNYYYELEVTTQSAAIPEPSTLLLMLSGVALVWMKRRRDI